MKVVKYFIIPSSVCFAQVQRIELKNRTDIDSSILLVKLAVKINQAELMNVCSPLLVVLYLKKAVYTLAYIVKFGTLH